MNKIAIIMCTWQRIERFEKTLNMLVNQKDKDFDFYVWNNNKDIVDTLEKLIVPYGQHLSISIHHSEKNVGGFGRFLFANQLEGYEYVIFIDDDQEFNSVMVENFRDKADKNALKSRWAFKTINCKYNQRQKINRNNIKCNYLGTGGMIAPLSLFNEVPELFAEYETLPEEYKFIEDINLCYIAQSYGGLDLLSIADTGFIKQIVDGKDQSDLPMMIKKIKFMTYLITEKKWRFKPKK